jgi:hypothetical protein
MATTLLTSKRLVLALALMAAHAGPALAQGGPAAPDAPARPSPDSTINQLPPARDGLITPPTGGAVIRQAPAPDPTPGTTPVIPPSSAPPQPPRPPG